MVGSGYSIDGPGCTIMQSLDKSFPLSFLGFHGDKDSKRKLAKSTVKLEKDIRTSAIRDEVEFCM
jgi:hypothetical protein